MSTIAIAAQAENISSASWIAWPAPSPDLVSWLAVRQKAGHKPIEFRGSLPGNPKTSLAKNMHLHVWYLVQHEQRAVIAPQPIVPSPDDQGFGPDSIHVLPYRLKNGTISRAPTRRSIHRLRINAGFISLCNQLVGDEAFVIHHHFKIFPHLLRRGSLTAVVAGDDLRSLRRLGLEQDRAACSAHEYQSVDALGIIQRHHHGGPSAHCHSHDMGLFNIQSIEKVFEYISVKSESASSHRGLVGLPIARQVDDDHAEMLRQGIHIAAKIAPAESTGRATMDSDDGRAVSRLMIMDFDIASLDVTARPFRSERHRFFQ